MVFDAPPATVAHSWMPISPCGPGCVQAADTAGSARVIGRAMRLAGLLASYPAAHVLTPAHAASGCSASTHEGCCVAAVSNCA